MTAVPVSGPVLLDFISGGVVMNTVLDPSVKRFNEIKVRDEVVSRYTESIAISVQKP